MTKTTKTEYLSALLDDEAGTFEQRRILDELSRDPTLMRKVSTWSLIGETMRNKNATITAPAGFLASIHEQLEEEPVYNEVLIEDLRKSSGRAAWFKPAAGMAIAASVAAITVVILQKPQDTIAADAGVIANTANETPSVTVMTAVDKPAVAEPRQDVQPYYATDAEWRKRLVRYVNDHAKYASKSAIMPSVRAVSYASNY